MQGLLCKLLHSGRVRSLSIVSHRKDKRQSDSMDLACDMVKLPWVYRKALLILDKLEVTYKLPARIYGGSRPSTCQSASFCQHSFCLCLQVEDNEEHIKTTIKAGGLMDVVSSMPPSP